MSTFKAYLCPSRVLQAMQYIHRSYLKSVSLCKLRQLHRQFLFIIGNNIQIVKYKRVI